MKLIQSRNKIYWAALVTAAIAVAWFFTLFPKRVSAEHSREHVVLRIGDEELTAEQFELLKGALPGGQADTTANIRGRIIDQIVRVKALAQEARRRRLDQKTPTEIAIRFSGDQVLSSALKEQISVQSAVSETSAKKYYDAHYRDYTLVEARHILVRFKGSIIPARKYSPELSQEEALTRIRVLRAKLKEGADFDRLARVESDDLATAIRGGSLGSLNWRQSGLAFERAAFDLSDGSISQPIQTSYGYHLVQTLKRHQRPFADVQEEIVAQLRKEQIRQASDQIVSRAKVFVNDQYFQRGSNGECASCAR